MYNEKIIFQVDTKIFNIYPICGFERADNDLQRLYGVIAYMYIRSHSLSRIYSYIFYFDDNRTTKIVAKIVRPKIRKLSVTIEQKLTFKNNKKMNLNEQIVSLFFQLASVF